jgi:hypothetical protein
MSLKKLIFVICVVFSFSSDLFSEENLPLRGEGDYTWYLLHVYQAKLYTVPGENLYLNPLVLELKYSRSLKGKDIADRSIKELIHAEVDQNSIDQLKPILIDIFPDVNNGDNIKATFDPKTGIIFYFNSTKILGKLTDLKLAKSFLDIWLGEKTNAKDLRNQLLGIHK